MNACLIDTAHQTHKWLIYSKRTLNDCVCVRIRLVDNSSTQHIIEKKLQIIKTTQAILFHLTHK